MPTQAPWQQLQQSVSMATSLGTSVAPTGTCMNNLMYSHSCYSIPCCILYGDERCYYISPTLACLAETLRARLSPTVCVTGPLPFFVLLLYPICSWPLPVPGLNPPPNLVYHCILDVLARSFWLTLVLCCLPIMPCFIKELRSFGCFIFKCYVTCLSL